MLLSTPEKLKEPPMVRIICTARHVCATHQKSFVIPCSRASRSLSHHHRNKKTGRWQRTSYEFKNRGAKHDEKSHEIASLPRAAALSLWAASPYFLQRSGVGSGV